MIKELQKLKKQVKDEREKASIASYNYQKILGDTKLSNTCEYYANAFYRIEKKLTLLLKSENEKQR